MREFKRRISKSGQEVDVGISLCDYSPPLIQALFLWRGQREINGLKTHRLRFTLTSVSLSARTFLTGQRRSLKDV